MASDVNTNRGMRVAVLSTVGRDPPGIWGCHQGTPLLAVLGSGCLSPLLVSSPTIKNINSKYYEFRACIFSREISHAPSLRFETNSLSIKTKKARLVLQAGL